MSIALSCVPQFSVKQRIALMINRYEILDASDTLIAFAEQKRMKLREEIQFFSDPGKAEHLFSIKSRQRLDIRARSDVLDTDGNIIGWFQKDFGKSLIRSTWHLHYGTVESVGTERNALIAILRRFQKVLPLPYHFNFQDSNTDNSVMSIDRVRSIRDNYRVEVTDPGLCFAVAASMAVALDAFQNR